MTVSETADREIKWPVPPVASPESAPEARVEFAAQMKACEEKLLARYPEAVLLALNGAAQSIGAIIRPVTNREFYLADEGKEEGLYPHRRCHFRDSHFACVRAAEKFDFCLRVKVYEKGQPREDAEGGFVWRVNSCWDLKALGDVRVMSALAIDLLIAC